MTSDTPTDRKLASINRFGTNFHKQGEMLDVINPQKKTSDDLKLEDGPGIFKPLCLMIVKIKYFDVKKTLGSASGYLTLGIYIRYLRTLLLHH